MSFHIDKIPKFYNKNNSNDNGVWQKLRQQARNLYLERLSKDAVENDELQQLWMLLEKNSSLPDNNDYNEHKIGYLEFNKIRKELNPEFKIRKYFTASTFAKLADPSGEKVSTLTLFKYVMRKIWMQQARISLSYWDSTGNGYLCEYDLENYIREVIPTLTKLNNMDKSYYPFYVCVATRKFFFFLDPYKHNKIKILDILYSGFLDDLLELRNEDLNKTVENFNWFSSANTIRLYNTYLDLDDDHNGMISKSEFMKFGNFNEVFVEQLFDVCITYNKEIDFKTFIDIILALENRKEIQSIYFFFTILDIDRKKYLDDFSLRYFFKAIENQMRNQGQEPISFDDFSNEIYDMVRPSTKSRKIYFEDLIASGHSDTIINILIDFNGFYAYENRDSNIRAKNISLFNNS